MKCPVCLNPDLLMSERFGIEIDYCPQCRGVWLDRGELDKIIERSMREPVQEAPAPSPAMQSPYQAPQHYSNGHGHHGRHHDDHHGYRAKHSFWKELFD
jgi:hypothetical protein